MTRKSKVTILLTAVAAVAFLAYAGIQLEAKWEAGVYRYKVARDAVATVTAKQWNPSGLRGAGLGVVKFSIDDFRVENYAKSADGEWHSTGRDKQTSNRLLTEEKLRQESRSWDVSQTLYDEIALGDRIVVVYRLEADDRSIEVITIRGKTD